MMKAITTTEKRGFFVLAIVFVLSLYFGFTDVDYFDNNFSVEDGPVEWGTAIMLFCVSVFSLVKLISLWKHKSIAWRFGFVMFTLLFFFAAGEEISWGQRIFGIESSEYFIENNAQGETNLHNMVVGGKKLNKIIFSQLLTLITVLYLVLAPILYRKKMWAKNLLNKFGVPVVYWHQTIAFVVSTVIILVIPSNRKWEVYELAFALIFFLIYLNPLNKDIIYTRSKA